MPFVCENWVIFDCCSGKCLWFEWKKFDDYYELSSWHIPDLQLLSVFCHFLPKIPHHYHHYHWSMTHWETIHHSSSTLHQHHYPSHQHLDWFISHFYNLRSSLTHLWPFPDEVERWLLMIEDAGLRGWKVRILPQLISSYWSLSESLKLWWWNTHAAAALSSDHWWWWWSQCCKKSLHFIVVDAVSAVNCWLTTASSLFAPKLNSHDDDCSQVYFLCSYAIWYISHFHHTSLSHRAGGLGQHWFSDMLELSRSGLHRGRVHA